MIFIPGTVRTVIENCRRRVTKTTPIICYGALPLLSPFGEHKLTKRLVDSIARNPVCRLILCLLSKPVVYLIEIYTRFRLHSLEYNIHYNTQPCQQKPMVRRKTLQEEKTLKRSESR
jgi:hypothetical protein